MSNDPPSLPGSNPSLPMPPALPAGVGREEILPIQGLAGALEAILRHPSRVTTQLQSAGPGKLTGAFLLIAIVSSLVYGLVVGTFSGGTQLWAAPVKVAGGLLFSALICLPSLYIFSCLAGAKARLVEIVGLVAGMLALMTVLLIGFAPVAWVFSQSTGSVVAMGVLHLVFWLIATWFGLRFLNRGFGLVSGMGGGLKVWLGIFVLVMLQMSTALRPLVGRAPTLMPTEKKFFLVHWVDSIQEPKTEISSRALP